MGQHGNHGLCPFTHWDDIRKLIPSSYFKNDAAQGDDFSWFVSTPKYTTVRVNTIKTTPEEALMSVRAKLPENDELDVYIHDKLKDCLVIGPSKKSDPIDDESTSMGKIIVDLKCGQAVLRGANVFAPGLLGMPPGTKIGDTVDVLADINNKCRRGLSSEFCGRTIFVGRGIVKMDRYELFNNDAHPNGIAIEMIYRPSKIVNVSIDPQIGVLQNLPSILCGIQLDLSPEHMILDMCASPGNKTAHLATLLGNKGVLIAVDRTGNKTQKIRDLCSSLGITNVKTFAWDSTQSVNFDSPSGRVDLDKGPPFGPSSFDRILLDAPCSALGQRPNLSNWATVERVTSSPKLQKKLFDNAAQLVKPGGIIVYSTCSITLDENENLVSWALNKYKDLRLIPIEPKLGRIGLPESKLSAAHAQMVQRFGPPISDSPDSDCIGFFIAKFTRIS